MMQCLRGFKLHIFDLDDTLVNTRQSYTEAQTTAFDSVFRDVEETKRRSHLELLYWLCRRFGSGCPEQYFGAFLRCADLSVGDENGILDSLLESYRLAFYEKIRPLKKVKDYLERLRANGCRLAIVSNGLIASQEKKMSVAGLDSYFPKEARFFSESFPPSLRKPSPHMISAACSKLDVEGSLSVYYGNEVDDIVAGNLAGVATVLVGPPKPNESAPHRIAKSDFRLRSWESVGHFD